MPSYGDATQFRVSQFAAVVEFTPDAYWLTSQTEPTEAPLATIGSRSTSGHPMVIRDFQER